MTGRPRSTWSTQTPQFTMINLAQMALPPDASCAPFPHRSPPTASSRRSMWWFEASARRRSTPPRRPRPGPRGPSSHSSPGSRRLFPDHVRPARSTYPLSHDPHRARAELRIEPTSRLSHEPLSLKSWPPRYEGKGNASPPTGTRTMLATVRRQAAEPNRRRQETVVVTCRSVAVTGLVAGRAVA